MSGPTIDQAFITKFNSDVHIAFQQMSSKLRGLVRTDGQVVGNVVRFQRMGTLNTVSKARNGEIPLQNVTHSFAEATMADAYSAVIVDDLDLPKLNIDVRGGLVTNMGGAFGRETDQVLIRAMQNGTTVNINGFTNNFTRNLAIQVGEELDRRDVPDDGNRFCVVTPRAWSHLMCIDQFVRSDYVGPDLPFKRMGIEVRSWNRLHWLVHNYLPGVGTTQARCYAWHPRAVGHGIAAEVKTMWDWKIEKWAWIGAGAMSMGAVVIDNTGIIEVRVNDTTATP